MKWIRILLPVFLVVGLLLSVSSVAYADDPDDGGLAVDITVVGDDADVEIDVIGDDAEVTVNTTGTDIYLNGQNINEPRVIIRKSTSGASKGWIVKRIDQAVGSLYSWAGDAQARISLTADGLAKVILVITDQDSQLDKTSVDIEGLNVELETQNTRLDSHEDRLTGLDEHVEALEAQDANTQAFVRDYANYLQADYDKKIVIISGAFLMIVIGLAVGFGISIHRLRRYL